MMYRLFLSLVFILASPAYVGVHMAEAKSAEVKTLRKEVIDLKTFVEADFKEVAAAWKMLDRTYGERSLKADLDGQKRGDKTILIARQKGELCGFVTIEWHPSYPPFAKDNIPEIADLFVLPKFQRRGIGTHLVEACEDLARKKGLKYMGIGVAVAPEYGPAQRLYVSIGYVPDGKGLQDNERPTAIGEVVTVGHRLGIYLTKKL